MPSLIFLNVPPDAIQRPGDLHLDLLQWDIGIKSHGGTRTPESMEGKKMRWKMEF